MFATAFAETRREASAASIAAAAGPYAGPERRACSAWLSASLDEIDYGMLLLGDAGRVVHANHAARVELDGEHPLLLLGDELRARHAHDIVPLHTALQNAAQRSLRKLLTLGESANRVSVSVVPLGTAPGADAPNTLVMLSKRQVCQTLSVHGFARCHGLTPAETRVLVALCQGVPPADVAVEIGVGIATVRSQIGSIRQKTGAPSIRALVRQVAVLPPLMGTLRCTVTQPAPADERSARLLAA